GAAPTGAAMKRDPNVIAQCWDASDTGIPRRGITLSWNGGPQLTAKLPSGVVTSGMRLVGQDAVNSSNFIIELYNGKTFYLAPDPKVKGGGGLLSIDYGDLEGSTPMMTCSPGSFLADDKIKTLNDATKAAGKGGKRLATCLYQGSTRQQDVFVKP